jgi:hypothetical protein
MKTNDGGPAFPCHTNKLDVCAVTGKEFMIPILNGGMTLRDYFAASVAPGILDVQMENASAIWKASGAGVPSEEEQQQLASIITEQAAKNAYKFADAMLLARKATLHRLSGASRERRAQAPEAGSDGAGEQVGSVRPLAGDCAGDG